MLFSRRKFIDQGIKLAGGLSLASLLPMLEGCGGSGGVAASVPQSVASQWISTALTAIINVKPGPPITARALGILGTSMFDAWACFDSVALGTRLGSSLRRPKAESNAANKSKAISFAAYRVLTDLFPTQSAVLNAQMAALGFDPSDTSHDPSLPQGIGNLVSAALISFRHNDGSNQLNNYADTTGYVPVNTPDLVVDPSKWQQLRFANGASPAYVAPHWGNVVPFALTSPSALRPPPPPAYGTTTYLDQAQEVIDMTANLNDYTQSLAEYWIDGPGTVQPPGHWLMFGQQVSSRLNYGLDQDVQLFFLLGNAVMDAGIACWECKRFYNTSRPITFIRALFAGKTIPSYGGPSVVPVIIDGSLWAPVQSPNFITPAFPEYVSGHSSFSTAAAQVLRQFTGSDEFGFEVTVPAGSSKIVNGSPVVAQTLSFATFTDAANSAGISRLYGGIHARAGNEQGLALGRSVGSVVYDMCMAYITGSAGNRILP